MKKIVTWVSSIIILAILIIVATTYFLKNSPSSQTKTKAINQNDAVTVFLHGYGGSANSEKFMVNQAVHQGITHNVITANVSSEGKVTFKGKFSKPYTNPIVKVELDDNKQGDLKQNATWFKNVLVKLQQDYHIQKFNFVGHSMGNLTFAYYMKLYGNDEALPQLKKEVNIAGTYNGVLNMNEKVNEISVDSQGKPSKMNQPYQQLLELKDIYRNKGIKVLNIYGDIQDGSHSDGRVSNSSSKSLKYLLGNSVSSYHESKYYGDKAQHSELHENNEVANEIIKFLWQ